MLISIPTTANSWVVNNSTDTTIPIITESGIENWTDSNSKIRTYFRVEKTGEINIGFKTKVIRGASEIKRTYGKTSKQQKLDNTSFIDVFIGEFNIKEPGYHFVEIQGIQKKELNLQK